MKKSKKDVPKTALEKLIKGGRERNEQNSRSTECNKSIRKNNEKKTQALSGISFDVEKRRIYWDHGRFWFW